VCRFGRLYRASVLAARQFIHARRAGERVAAAQALGVMAMLVDEMRCLGAGFETPLGVIGVWVKFESAALGDGALAALDELVAEGTVVAEFDVNGTASYRSASSQRRSTGVGRSMVSLLDDLIAEDSSDDTGA
jgi:hypothetical protein